MSQEYQQVYDLAIVGAGIPGASLALQAARLGLRVALLDQRETLVRAEDTRTTALMPESLLYLESLGLLAPLGEQGQPLHAMRLMNDQGPQRDAPETLTFHGKGGAPLALNISNQVLAHALSQAMAAEPSLNCHWGCTITEARCVSDQAHLHLADGSQIIAPLCVVADGRTSPTRRYLGIGWRTLLGGDGEEPPGQIALTARLRHRQPHEGISTEFHRRPGPMTFVPIAGDGHDIALVWCLSPSVAAKLRDLDDANFLRRVQIASHGILGTLSGVSTRGCFPVRPGAATTLTKGPYVLVAEAAHALPPLLAQGLNLSLSDVACLGKLLEEGKRGLNLAQAYGRARWPDVQARLTISEGLNQFLQHAPGPLPTFYTWGHRALQRFPAARKAAVKIGQRGQQRLPE